MANVTVLLVGGPLDGQRRELSKPLPSEEWFHVERPVERNESYRSSVRYRRMPQEADNAVVLFAYVPGR